MIDIRLLEKDQINPETGRTPLEEYRRCLAARALDPGMIDQLLALNKKRRSSISEAEKKKAEQNKFGPIIAQKKRNKESADDEIAAMQELSQAIKALEAEAESVDQRTQEMAMGIPNFLHASVPVGKSEEENVVVRSFGEPTRFAFEPKEHSDLGEKSGLIDFARASKVTGARFAFLRKGVARLERALINFMLDLHTKEHGYEEMLPPFIVNSDSLRGTAQFPKFKEDVFALAGSDYFLIPTAEVPVTNYFREEILEETDLPICFAAYSPCFRSEAGSYGRDTKGLIRQHQFEKVELMKFSHPQDSYEQHEKLVANAEEVLKRLELPFQTLLLCSGDIGYNAAKCYDLNVWLPGQKAYREISSCSNFEDFQARRANIRYRPKGGGKPAFVHTINGSGLAIGRTLIAIMENYQNEDGSIRVPKALRPYLGDSNTVI